MSKKDDYFDDGISVDQKIDLDSTNIHVTTISKHDFTDVITGKTRKQRVQSGTKTFKYVLGDVYRLCIASDKHEAMLLFGAVDPMRVDIVSGNSQYTFDIFRPHTVLYSDYNPSVLILEFPFK